MTRATNAFDQLRLVAASSVLFSHSFPFVGLKEPMIFGDTLGRLAVLVFFALSGYLVCKSWQSDPDVPRFICRRAIRILPGLVVAVLVTTLTIGLAATTLAATSFLTDGRTWSYVLSNALGIAGVLTLPGVFALSPQPVFNDSLWTLRYEMLMYASLVLMALTGGLRIACIGLTAVSGALSIALAVLSINHLDLAIPVLWRTGLSFDFVWLARFATAFFGAASLAFFPRVRYDWRLGFLFIAIICAIPAGRVQGAFAVLVLPYLIMLVALRAPAVLRKELPFDLSYGIYVYAYPVQQIASEIASRSGYGWLASTGSSVAVVGALALMSWHFVEEPAMRLKPRKPSPLPPPARV